VVHAFGREKLEGGNFCKYLDRTKDVQKAANFSQSIGHGVLLATILGFYAYAFYWGGYLKWNGLENRDEEYTGGSIIQVMFCVILGAILLGGAANHLKAITEAKVAGKVAFDTVETCSGVNSCSGSKASLVGNIEFKSVSFSYPTRKDQQVLKDFSCTLEAGKTTALVGPSGSGKSTVV